MSKKNDFQIVLEDGNGFGQIWSNMIQELDGINALDKKTRELIYVSLLAALGLETDIPHHVQQLKSAGGTEDELVSAILMGLPVAGKTVTTSLGIALDAYRK